MKHSKFLLIGIIPLLLGGCGSEGETSTSSTTPPIDTSKGKVQAKLNGSLNPDRTSGYDLTFDFDDAYFDNNAKIENQNLKLLSFASSMSSAKESLVTYFYTSMFYDNPQVSGYDVIDENSIGYCLAHKSIKDYELVSISIRGLDYKQEWASNFKIGKSGNHTGFEEKATEIYDSLKTYLAPYSQKEIKLWISGYSRGGGVGNVLASLLLKEKTEINVKSENLFVYTFEAPRGLSEENAIEYQNVFNYVNSDDPVPLLAPVEYGLYRCGKDIFINENKDVEQALYSFDEGAVLPSFTPSESNYNDQKGFNNFIFAGLLKDTEDPSTNLNTRETFVDNYQDGIGYLIGLFFTLSDGTINKIISTLKTQLEQDPFSIILILSDGGIYNFLKPILDEDQVPYDNEKFEPACQSMNKLLQAKFSLLAHFIDTSAMSINQAAANNMMRAIDMHLPETVYALIK